MPKAISDTKNISGIEKKRGPGRPTTGISGNVGLRLYPEMLEAIDDWILGQSDPKPSRPEAIRQLLRIALGDKMRT